MENRGSKFYSKAWEKYFSWLKEFMSTVRVGSVGVEGVRREGLSSWFVLILIFRTWIDSRLFFVHSSILKYIYIIKSSALLLLWKQNTISQIPQPWLYFKVWLIFGFSSFSFLSNHRKDYPLQHFPSQGKMQFCKNLGRWVGGPRSDWALTPPSR